MALTIDEKYLPVIKELLIKHGVEKGKNTFNV